MRNCRPGSAGGSVRVRSHFITNFPGFPIRRALVMQALQEPLVNVSEMTTLLSALTALRKGKANVRLPLDWTGVAGKVADAFNQVVEMNERMAGELARLSRV